MASHTIVVGAGVAGLQCARRLEVAGQTVTVIEKARGVGGRCATRRFDEQPIDFGVLFFHGHDPEFLAAIEELPGEGRLDGWPVRIQDTGRPCQPEAFAPYERRFALTAGVSTFPKHLARDLDVRLSTRVTSVEPTGDGMRLTTEAGDNLEAQTVVLALPLEQTSELLGGLDDEQARAARAVIGMFASQPCLTVIAGYGLDSPEIPWDISYPSASKSLMVISNESSKRDTADHRVLVYQARPGWSRRNLEEDPETWSGALMVEAAALLGAWAGRPAFTHPHRWRYGRIDQSTELNSAMVLPYPGGSRLGIAGDVFAGGGGVQAAWLAGNHLADRLENEEQK